MRKLISVLLASGFAFATAGAWAAAPAMTDAEKMEVCKAIDPATADAKTKAECKKLMEKK